MNVFFQKLPQKKTHGDLFGTHDLMGKILFDHTVKMKGLMQ